MSKPRTLPKQPTSILRVGGSISDSGRRLESLRYRYASNHLNCQNLNYVVDNLPKSNSPSKMWLNEDRIC